MKTFSGVLREAPIPPSEDTREVVRRERALPLASQSRAFITTLPAAPGDQRRAAAVVGVSAALFVALLPFAKQQLPQVWVFIPAYQSALVVCDLVTAALLLGQVRFSRSAPLFVLALAYLFSAALAVIHALSFPGLFAPGGVLGGGAQSTAWLYMFWHAGFPLLVIAYALMPERSLGNGFAGGVGALAAAVGVRARLATTGEALLP